MCRTAGRVFSKTIIKEKKGIDDDEGDDVSYIFFFFFLILPIWPRENVGAFRGCMKWCCAGELRLKKHKVRVYQLVGKGGGGRETHRTGVIKV